jgi:hypothetical protein
MELPLYLRGNTGDIGSKKKGELLESVGGMKLAHL